MTFYLNFGVTPNIVYIYLWVVAIEINSRKMSVLVKLREPRKPINIE